MRKIHRNGTDARMIEHSVLPGNIPWKNSFSLNNSVKNEIGLNFRSLVIARGYVHFVCLKI